jgi:hypothetical protein
VVQSGNDASTPVSYAALTYDLPEASSVGKLVLKVAASSGTTLNSSLALCPLRDPDFTQVQGGALSDGPAYDCARQVVAPPSDDGTSYTFSVAGLRAGDAVAVAILAVSPAARVVLAPPATDSLAVTELTTQVASGPATTSTAVPPAAPEGSSLAAPDSTTLQAVDTPPVLPPAAQLPAVAAAAPEQADGDATVAAPATVPVADQTDAGGGFQHGGALALVLCVIVAGAWAAAGASASRPLPPPT